MKRFIFVRAPNSRVVHRYYHGKSEGPAACGTQVRKGWSWFEKRTPETPVCKRCDR